MTTTTPARPTVHQIVALYRAGDAMTRAQLRATYPRMKLEFDAIDRELERQARIQEQGK